MAQIGADLRIFVDIAVRIQRLNEYLRQKTLACVWLSAGSVSGIDEKSFRKFLFSSLRARLLLLVAIAVIPILGLTIYSALEQRHLAGYEVQETTVRLARVASSQQGQLILGTRQLLTGLAQLREVRQGSPGECSAVFAKLAKSYPVYSNLGAVDRDGEVYCSARPMTGSVNVSDRSYFVRAMQSADFAIGDYQIGRITFTATLTLAYPIFDRKQQVNGVVFAALDLAWLNQLVKEADLPAGSIFTLTDKHGTILVRYPEPEKWVGRSTAELSRSAMARSSGTGVAEASEPDGVPRLIGFTPLLGREQTGDVYVSIGIPKKAAFAEADHTFARNLGWLALIASIAFAAAWFGGDVFVLRQVSALVGMARQLEKGNLTRRVGPPYGKGELGQLAKSFDEMAASLQKSALQFRYQATHDSLTGLANRSFFTERLEEEISNAQAHGEPLALLLMDLDSFREINDTIGHYNGDRVLREVTQRLTNSVGQTGVVGRLGGDEFAVVLLNTDPEGAADYTRKLMGSFHRPIILDELPIAIELSLGIAVHPRDGEDADLLIRRAEVAMYLAKEGKSGYEFYALEKDQYRPERLVLLAELRRAIRQNQLYLEYQPKIELRTGRVSGVEALVRWRHPKLGIVRPDQFISIAEHTGLMKPLTFWVLNEALRQCLAWHQAGVRLSAAVNISSRNLEAGLPEQIAAMLDLYGLTPEWLELEITEGTIMKDPVHAKQILTRLGEKGIKISIDDFGTGYSSLSYLSALPVNQIKIDKSFVINMNRDQKAAAIVRSTIDLGHELGLEVAAEGVENQEILEKLALLGCNSAQGYHIGRPVSSADFAKWLTEYQKHSLP